MIAVYEQAAAETVDFVYILSGKLILEFDDGVTVELQPGESVVQNGTRHTWRDPFDEPCHMLVFSVGGKKQ